MQLETNVESAITAEAFQSYITAFQPPLDGSMAVAVSGGPDSMALIFCLKRWCEANQKPLPLGLIVDHGLRDASDREALDVKQSLSELGLQSEILRWEHEEVTSRLHNEARKARYRLLLEACARHAITNLFFAHHRDDQAETILMRFSKGTGLDGLAGMAADSRKENMRIVRPLLSLPKTSLISTCEAAGISFVTDQSNEQTKFARGRLRRVMPLLADEGLTTDRLLDFSARAAEAKDALDFYTADFMSRAGHMDEWGVVTINKAALISVPRAIALRALGKSLQAVHLEEYDPQHASLTAVLDALALSAFSSRTLNGCLLSCPQDELKIIREFSSIPESVEMKSGDSIVWDDRWQVSLAASVSETYKLKSLGNPPHDVLDRIWPDLRRRLPQGQVRATLPSLWQGDELALLPFDPKAPCEARLVSTLQSRAVVDAVD